MAPHTITQAVAAVCRCKAKAGLRRSPRCPHTRTRLSSLLRLNLDSRASLKTTWFHSAAIKFPRAWRHSKPRHRGVGVKGSVRNGCRYPKRPSARRLRMVRETQRQLGKVLPVPGWWPMKQLVFTRAFLMIRRPSRRLVYRGRPESGLRVNDISRIHGSQYHITTQSKWPN
ncbi:uncharacterized protein TNCV_107471 [Trichonephila clavipes]|nr:uncharacterized protein TNCV_107471 [Trichonephila clavipes]